MEDVTLPGDRPGADRSTERTPRVDVGRSPGELFMSQTIMPIEMTSGRAWTFNREVNRSTRPTGTREA